jgi:hypothetical protein
MVVVGGALLRLGVLYDSAMAVILAFGAAAMAEPGEDRGGNGVPGTGRALYEGIAVVASSALQGGNAWKDTMLAGTRQLGNLIWALIGMQDRHADAESLHCLLEVMDAAVSGADLPRCAGGPTPGGLQVVSASYDGAARRMRSITGSTPGCSSLPSSTTRGARRRSRCASTSRPASTRSR